ncbi:hypothetical protein AWU65_27850 [Paenibacillus glucanolyticus]|uniref:Uncharacterized protein n=1 Tax=Paenibacillus glucanolyticus TaxID=59843 RepID=A0A163EMY7_9BACL|nr:MULTISPECIES: hypothetical protein [Paenibacillus]AWP26745.1 hypothetical protein B9D94_09000 [Paenibacillus sp. Cedars]KZS43896.1 hypothetical protein AWU65_27850 [Paenibacillus glucanolyticus]
MIQAHSSSNMSFDMTELSQSITLLLSSIAVEEMALAHIVNGEAEKIQYVLGTLQPSLFQPEDVSVDNLLAINDSVQRIMEDVLLREVMLQMKFSHIMMALEVNSMRTHRT